MTTASIQVADGTLLTTRTWEPSDPKADLIIVHGIGEHAGRWEHVGRLFADKGYRVTAYNLRGHGLESDAPLDLHSFDQYVDDLQEVIQNVRSAARPLFIYGHSMGGLITTRYACSDRPQPNAYVLSAPALEARLPCLLRFIARVLNRIFPWFPVESPIKPEQLSRIPAVGEAYFTDPYVTRMSTVRHGCLVVDAMTDTKKQLDRLRVHTLVIHGGDDTLVPTKSSEILVENPLVTRKVFDGLRHEIHNEPESEEVLSHVDTWLIEHL